MLCETKNDFRRGDGVRGTPGHRGHDMIPGTFGKLPFQTGLSTPFPLGIFITIVPV